MKHIAPIRSDAEAAALTRADYERIMREREDARDLAIAEDVLAKIKSGEIDSVPGRVLGRIVSGENPIRVWREYRGLSRAELAAVAGVTKREVSEIETGDVPGSLVVLDKNARRLNVELGELEPFVNE